MYFPTYEKPRLPPLWWDRKATGETMNFMSKKVNPTTQRLILVYLLGLIVLATTWWVGVLGPVVVASGWVGKVVFSLVLAHMVLAFYTLRKVRLTKPFILCSPVEDLEPADVTKLHALRSNYRKCEGLIEWLRHITTSILAVGFLGKLYGIAQVLNAVVGSNADGAKMISHGVAVALYSTIMGMGLSLWTHCANIVVSNKINANRE